MANQQSATGLAKFGDLKNRLLFLLGALLVFRIGAHIPVPGVDAAALAKLYESAGGGILGMLNMFSGGSLERFSIFAIGIMSYISASIIVQLASEMVPSLKALKKEGEAGKRVLTKYTRYGTVGLTAIQGYFIAVGLEAEADGVHAVPHAGGCIGRIGEDVPQMGVASRAADLSAGISQQVVGVLSDGSRLVLKETGPATARIKLG